MSLARGSQNGGHYYSNIVMPQEVAIQFVVNAADTGGLGVTGVKSNGWARNVFMHTSATAGTGNDSVTNPNPDTGDVIIQLKQNFNAFLGLRYSFQAPVTGAALTSVTNHTAYQIVTTGTTTAAQWVTAGVPTGVTAAAGVSFVAITTASIGGSGTVKALGYSGVMSFEVIGSTVLSNNSDIGSNGGCYLIGKFLNTSGTATNPTDTTVVNLHLYFDRSSVSVDGL